jgi:hypothetical protein
MSEVPEATRCIRCAATVPTSARFCGTCGAAREAAPAAVGVLGAPAGATGAPVTVTLSADPPRPPLLAGVAAGVPPEILVIAGLLAAGGLLLVIEALRLVPSIFDLLRFGSLGRALGLLLLDLVGFVGAFGVAGMLLAWRLALADRVARGLTYVVAGGTAAAILLGNEHSTAYVLVMLANLAAVAILALTPRVDAFFAQSPEGDQPTGVVVARTLLVAWAFCAGLTGLSFLPAGALGARFVLVGLLLIALAAGAFWLNAGVGRGEPAARNVATLGAGAATFLTLIAGHSNTGTLLPIALAVGLITSLWAPADCREFFIADDR